MGGKEEWGGRGNGRTGEVGGQEDWEGRRNKRQEKWEIRETGGRKGVHEEGRAFGVRVHKVGRAEGAGGHVRGTQELTKI